MLRVLSGFTPAAIRRLCAASVTLVISASVFADNHSSDIADRQKAALDMLVAKMAAGEVGAGEILFLPEEMRRVAYANFKQLAPTNTLSVSGSPLELTSAPADFSGVMVPTDAGEQPLASVLKSRPLMGMVAVQGDKIVLEQYAPDHGPESRWVSFSVTKSVTSLLIGAAIQDGYIRSVDDKVSDYLPRMTGTAYGNARIRDVLHMASGIAWNEDYEDRESDVAIAGAYNGLTLTNYLSGLPQVDDPGNTFNYNTGETNLAGEILRAAIGQGAADYLTAKIWKPFGMEHQANWLLDAPDGRETGGCCISATVRDYARLGMFALADGVLSDGTRVLPEGWMRDSTTASKGYDGYGYMWWLLSDQRFTARGIFGQFIFVDPKTNLVIAAHSNAQRATGTPYHDNIQAAFLAISDHLRSQ